MKKTLLFVTLFILGVGTLAIGSGAAYMWWALAPVDNKNVKIEINIPTGATATTVSNLLYKVGLVKNSQITGWYFAYSKLDRSLQAGKYTLSTSLSVSEIAEKLKSNPASIKVTLLEGWRREEMAVELSKTFEREGANFDKEKFLEFTENLEGKLFPDTYVFSPSSSVEQIVSVLVKNFDEKTKSIGIDVESLDKIVVLASLIEREAKTLEDKKLVSGVLMNRLNNNMPLQVDATLQYAKASRICGATKTCENWWIIPRSEDKELNSEYNTYQNIGLPPTAIANPGFDSLEAAWNPKPSEFVYYLTDNNGITHFAITYDEHLINIQKYLR